MNSPSNIFNILVSIRPVGIGSVCPESMARLHSVMLLGMTFTRPRSWDIRHLSKQHPFLYYPSLCCLAMLDEGVCLNPMLHDACVSQSSEKIIEASDRTHLIQLVALIAFCEKNGFDILRGVFAKQLFSYEGNSTIESSVLGPSDNQSSYFGIAGVQRLLQWGQWAPNLECAQRQMDVLHWLESLSASNPLTLFFKSYQFDLPSWISTSKMSLNERFQIFGSPYSPPASSSSSKPAYGPGREEVSYATVLLASEMRASAIQHALIKDPEVNAVRIPMFVKCDHQLFECSKLHGQVCPRLDSMGRFIRSEFLAHLCLLGENIHSLHTWHGFVSAFSSDAENEVENSPYASYSVCLDVLRTMINEALYLATEQRVKLDGQKERIDRFYSGNADYNERNGLFSICNRELITNLARSLAQSPGVGFSFGLVNVLLSSACSKLAQPCKVEQINQRITETKSVFFSVKCVQDALKIKT